MTSLAERLRIALSRSDAADLIASDLREPFDPNAPVAPAAVLVPVTDRPRPGVILTQRNAGLRRHAGQIAFPGGRIDPGDAHAIAAALREAEEEIALPPAMVEVIGHADRYRTATGYDVQPVVGIVPPDLIYVPSPAEVAAVFEVPLDFLMDRANHAEASADWRGSTRHFYEIRWGERRIWGATAAMIVNLSRRLQWTA